MLDKVSQLSIQYWFGYVDRNVTEKMISIFNEYLRSISGETMLIRQFDVRRHLEPHIAYHRCITTSVSESEASKKVYSKCLMYLKALFKDTEVLNPQCSINYTELHTCGISVLPPCLGSPSSKFSGSVLGKAGPHQPFSNAFTIDSNDMWLRIYHAYIKQ